MKTNDIISEGMWDNLTGAMRSAGAEFKKRQSMDNFQNRITGFISKNTNFLQKEWDKEKYSIPNINVISQNPQQYYNELAKFASEKLGSSVPKDINLPAVINKQGTADVIKQITAKHFYSKYQNTANNEPASTPTPTNEPASTPTPTNEPASTPTPTTTPRRNINAIKKEISSLTRKQQIAIYNDLQNRLF